MRKSELLSQKLNKAEQLIERAKRCVEYVLANDVNGDGCSGGRFMTLADELIDCTNEIGYEVVMPLEMQEDDREAEIAVLEARLAELRRE